MSNNSADDQQDENNVTVINVNHEDGVFMVKFHVIPNTLALYLESVPTEHQDKIIPNAQFNLKLLYNNNKLDVLYNFSNYFISDVNFDKRATTQKRALVNEDVFVALQQIVETRKQPLL